MTKKKLKKRLRSSRRDTDYWMQRCFKAEHELETAGLRRSAFEAYLPKPEQSPSSLFGLDRYPLL